MKILVTGFKPYGIRGFIFRKNKSEKVALKLKEKYEFETLILPVDILCVQKLVSKIGEYKPDIIICLGQSSNGFRIEEMCYKKTNEKDIILYSKFAGRIKKGLKGFVKNDIGDWYCNDIYYEALNRVPKTVFIHLPMFIKFRHVDEIIKFILKTESLNISSST